MPQRKKFTRIRNKNFLTFQEMLEFYEDNEEEIHSYTLNRLKEYWIKNKVCGDVDIYKVKIEDSPKISHMNVYKDEWEHALFLMEVYHVSVEDYEKASIVRDFSWEIFGKTEL